MAGLRQTWTSAAARRLIERAQGAATVNEAIRATVRELLQGVECPPTDLASVATKLNVTAVEAADLAGSGELRRDGSGFKVMYSSHLSAPRRRFTIAHELGHAFMESTGQRAPRNGRELERLCDMIATELLMPSEVFKSRIKADISVRLLFSLAREFQTSLSATAIRCAELSRVSVFGAQAGKMTWAHGRVKKTRPELLDDTLRHLIGTACAGASGETSIYLSHDGQVRPWRVQYQCLGQGRQAIFILTQTDDTSPSLSSPGWQAL